MVDLPSSAVIKSLAMDQQGVVVIGLTSRGYVVYVKDEAGSGQYMLKSMGFPYQYHDAGND